MSDKFNSNFELQYSSRVNETIPISKYKSKRTGVQVVVAHVEGPLVNGFFTLATEAHDDDGLPHTLEHLVFLGSESYPFKGVLDLLANRCLASGTNAWTDTDHTCYTITTAGCDGFLNLMPVYLDHILYPTLTDSGFITEVHHVNGEGDDAGVVYCEMQGRENAGESRVQLAFQRAMYPGHCGYKSETGGILHNLRTSTTHQKVVNYHKAFYRAENLYLIVTGMIDDDRVLKAIESFEETILAKGLLNETYVRPWLSPVPPLPQSVDIIERYPSDDEENGMVLIGWRGPLAKDQIRLAAITVLLEYLTDTAVAPLQRDFVELDDPYCSEVSYSVTENSESCFLLNFENVPVEKLNDIKPRLMNLIHNLASETEAIDMTRMHVVIHRHVLEANNNLEDKPHNTVAFYLIGDFLYGDSVDDLQLRLNQIGKFHQLDSEPKQFWIDLIKAYLYEKNTVTIIGHPSQELMEKMGEEEKSRVAQQAESLGADGLGEKTTALKKAIEHNEIPPPVSMLTKFPVPEVSSIHFHTIVPSSNHPGLSLKGNELFPLNEMPVLFELDDIKTNFVTMFVLLNTTSVPADLRLYLPLYLEVILESPILRNEVLIPYEDVVKELAADTLYNGTSLGATGGKRFSCGNFSAVASLKIKVEMDKYAKGVSWLRDLLYGVQFTAERVRIIANKMINDVATLKRDGQMVVRTVMNSMNNSKDTNHHVASMLRQHKFLSSVVEKLNKDTAAPQVLESLAQLQAIVTQPSNVRVHMTAHVERLIQRCPDRNAVRVWLEEFLPSHIKQQDKQATVDIPRDSLSIVKDVGSDVGYVVGVGSVESSFLIQCIPSVSVYDNPDIAAIMLFLQYLSQLEGPMWKQMRGQGLTYHYRIYLDTDRGLIYFVLYKSSQLVEAYQEAKKIVEEFAEGKAEFTDVELDAARSSLIFGIIEEEESPSDASLQSLLCYLRHVDHGYTRRLIKEIPSVTADDLRRVGRQYCSPLFDSSKSKVAICCHPTKVEEVQTEFSKRFGKQLKVIESLDDAFLTEL